MKNIVFFFTFMCGVTGNIFGQDLSQYQYVKVPKQFEFLKHQNQYELNALTAFLLEKYGYDALYEEAVPAGVDPCNVLEANVYKKSGLFRSRLYLTLEDCKDEVVFTSKTGVSREKNFKKSYHEALRDAFTSFQELRKDPEVIIDPIPAAEMAEKNTAPAEVIIDPVPAPEKVQEEPSEVIVDPIVTSEEMEKAEEQNSGLDFYEGHLQFVNGAVTYFLKETPVGFELYREGEKEKFGTLLKSGGGDNFLYSSKNLSGNAFFDAQGNLVVEYLDPNTRQLVSVIYKRKDQ
ncbi:hypothetical protein [Salinimicrobium sp. TH3]|uniref:hypothetical protein n=1 Tax=Salinimicrobium sp. TH3 TaxID=2997342 RepID=UPI00227501BA|nr:hypothetical protein [Salinimicrobium sp. TH3]MCY2688322.1 hypothetical protein [Salinimicrobium sp. TH3]